MKIKKDPENIGWAGCIYINTREGTILGVKSIKRRAQVFDWLHKKGYTDPQSQRKHWREALFELRRSGLLQKADKWGPPGGKISWWAGNDGLRKEYANLLEERQGEFLKEVCMRVLKNENLLDTAASETAEMEFVEETGLIVKSKRLLIRIDDKDKDNPGEIYPRFWYIVDEVEPGGALRTEAIKKTISCPRWLPILNLRIRNRVPTYADNQDMGSEEKYFLFHPIHSVGVRAAAALLVKEGWEDFKPVVKYLASEFPDLNAIEASRVERTENWEEIIKDVTPLSR